MATVRGLPGARRRRRGGRASTRRRCRAALLLGVGLLLNTGLLLTAACGLGDTVAQRPHGPSRVPVGDLVRATWLPAGLDELRFDAAHQQTLAALGLTQIQWLQRAERDGRSAEKLAMAFCDRHGLSLPVYYEAPGFSPYDKLHNWAAMTSRPDDFAAQVDARVAALQGRWATAPGFGGYLIGHEDYRAEAYPSLAAVVAALQRADGERPAVTVGALGHYPQRQRFLDAFFPDSGAVNVFEHEHYVFTADVPPAGRQALRALARLADSYDRVARALRDRHGRWVAIVQVHGESRDGEAFYRPPTAAEIRAQVGLALARGASGIVYFLYSSGVEPVHDGAGKVVQVRHYAGLVDTDGAVTERWTAVRELNARLAAIAPDLEDRYFRGGYAARRAPAHEPVSSAETDLDLAYFGDAAGSSHVLVVNRRTDGPRRVSLEVAAGVRLRDVETGQPLTSGIASLASGGFRLFRVER